MKRFWKWFHCRGRWRLEWVPMRWRQKKASKRINPWRTISKLINIKMGFPFLLACTINIYKPFFFHFTPLTNSLHFIYHLTLSHYLLTPHIFPPFLLYFSCITISHHFLLFLLLNLSISFYSFPHNNSPQFFHFYHNR